VAAEYVWGGVGDEPYVLYGVVYAWVGYSVDGHGVGEGVGEQPPVHRVEYALYVVDGW
jgi:hypothetical protein